MIHFNALSVIIHFVTLWQTATHIIIFGFFNI